MYFEDAPTRVSRNQTLSSEGEGFSSRIIVVDSMGIVLGDSAGQLSDLIGDIWINPTMMTALDGDPSYNISTEEGAFIQTAMPVIIADEVVGAVMLHHTMTETGGGIISGITDQVLLLIALIAATILVLVFLTASWLLNPLKSVSDAVKKVSAGDMGQRVQTTGRGEVYDLSVAFNDMSGKLAHIETARQEFVSNVSHELKTPLASIKVLSESLLHQENVPEETYKEFLEDIDSEVDRMTNIINELLTLVRLDETELPLNINTLSLNQLMADIIKRLQPLAQQKAVAVELLEDGYVNIDGDEMKLYLALSNVVENAIKYSHSEGHVKVAIKSDSKNAFISVTDQGVGIDPAEHDKVFTRFYRADKGRNRETGGTGLGLSITHKTMLLHRGRVTLTSALGEGSTFEIRIPKARH